MRRTPAPESDAHRPGIGDGHFSMCVEHTGCCGMSGRKYPESNSADSFAAVRRRYKNGVTVETHGVTHVAHQKPGIRRVVRHRNALVGLCHAWPSTEPSDDELQGECVFCARAVCDR